MKASDYIIDCLADQGITQVFGYIGGAIAHITDSLAKHDHVSMVNMIHEQGAGFAAEGYARATGKTGAATATSGPGATNLITAIGSCFFDSVPTLFLTGQVNTYEFKYERQVRQIGFQETDIVSIIKPITKYAVLIDDIENLRFELEKALFLAQHGRKGPVLVDIPMNIQRSEINPETARSFFESDQYKILLKQNESCPKIFNVIELLHKSSRPIILVGGGVRLSGATEILRELLERSGIPLVYSLMGKDCISDEYPYNLGLIGSYGNRYGNLALANSDLLIVLGSRLDTRQTGTNLNTFAREAAVVHVDIDPSELGAKIDADVKLCMDVKEFVEALKLHKFDKDYSEWYQILSTYKTKYSSLVDIKGNTKVPNEVVDIIATYANSNDLISVDVGQHQMWIAQSFMLKEHQRVFFSGGMGAMGFALPNAIGATMATGKRSIVIAGDGGMQMNIQELEIIKRRQLPIKIFILNNFNLGMVRQFQEIYFDKRYISTVDDYSVPNFSALAKAYGIDGVMLFYADDIKEKIALFLSDNKPGLMDIHLPEQMTTVEPKLIVNEPIENMYPFIDRDELEENMIIKPLDEL